MRFLKEDARHQILLNLAVVTFNEKGQYVDGLEKSVMFNLSDASYAHFRDTGFESKTEIKVPPGRYEIRAVLRESHEIKMGSIRKYIEVP